MSNDTWMDELNGMWYDIDGNSVTFREHIVAERWQLVDKEGGYRISTVFLGLRLGIGNSTPLTFETMCFGKGEHDQYQERYATKVEAEAGHVRAIRMVKSTTHENSG